jgi:putative membrane-bound dehydrogenase-like protein
MHRFCLTVTKRLPVGWLSLPMTLLVVLSCLATSEGADVMVNERQFTLPDGLELQWVAGPPLVNRPICADFDEQGRLYVADSSGSNEKIRVQLQKRPHRVVRLEDTDGDGRFDDSIVFADRMMFPEGALWHDGSLYVSAPPSIWKLTDTTGDGVADRREEWFQGQTLTGCANDLHGPYLGLDGWIYWCKGAFAEQTYERPGGKPLVTRAAHIFRRRPEGGVVEAVMTGGMDNPVEVAFTPGGERLFTTTFVQRPRGGKRDGLVHAVYGGVYGKKHHVIENHPRTGPVMPVLVHYGAGAPCGLVRLQTDELGKGFRNNFLTTLFNMHKVTRHVLAPAGGTFTSRNEDFLTSPDIDFHPTDVIEDADGSLLIVDTGGWYKLCCPTSQLWKPDVLGAIYRVRRSGGHRVVDARGLAIDWSGLSPTELTRLLGDARPAVRERAIEMLAKSGADSIEVLRNVAKTSADAEVRRNVVWTLTRISDEQARSAVRKRLDDADDEVRQTALHSVSVRRDKQAASQLRGLLGSTSPHNLRAAAEALGRIGDRGAVPDLLRAAGDAHDRVIEHSITFALIEIAEAAATRQGLQSDRSRTVKASLIALDQMEGGQLAVEEIVPLLSSTDPVLHETAWWIAERHPDWAQGLAGYFRDQIFKSSGEVKAAEELAPRLAKFTGDPTIGRLLVSGLRDASVPQTIKLAVLDAMAKSGLKVPPDAWLTELRRLLSSADPRLLQRAVSTIRAFPDAKPDQALAGDFRRLARNDTLPARLRLEALAATPKPLAEIGPEVFTLLLDHLPVEQPVPLRSLAVDALVEAKLMPRQLDQLAEALVDTGPMELKRLLAAFEQSPNEQMGVKLVEVLQRCPAASSLQPQELDTWFSKFGNTVATRAETLLAMIRVQYEEKRKQLEIVLSLLEKGDKRRGQLVFQSSKAACAACHAFGYLGGNIGPDLTGIGRIRNERDLLEAILFPSQSFVRSYEPVMILTTSGKVYSGVVRDETDTEVILSVDAQKLERIRHDEIEERQPGKVSIMPAGLGKQFTVEELADLIVFLKAAQ